MPMFPVMNGQAATRAPGVQELLAPAGRTDHREHLPGAAQGARAPVAIADGTGMRPADFRVVITPDLLADLYDPTLVISHGYVGPERRHADRSARARETHSWFRKPLSVALLTAAVVIPLTMIAARSFPPVTSGRPTAPATGQPAPGSTAGPTTRRTQVPGASSRQIARTEAASQRALARAGAAAAARSAALSAAPQHTAASAAGAAAGAVAVQARADAWVATATSRQARAEARAAAQATRAKAQATRAKAQAARAKAQAARVPGRFGSHPGAAGTPSGA